VIASRRDPSSGYVVSFFLSSLIYDKPFRTYPVPNIGDESENGRSSGIDRSFGIDVSRSTGDRERLSRGSRIRMPGGMSMRMPSHDFAVHRGSRATGSAASGSFRRSIHRDSSRRRTSHAYVLLPLDARARFCTHVHCPPLHRAAPRFGLA